MPGINVLKIGVSVRKIFSVRLFRFCGLLIARVRVENYRPETQRMFWLFNKSWWF